MGLSIHMHWLDEGSIATASKPTLDSENHRHYNLGVWNATQASLQQLPTLFICWCPAISPQLSADLLQWISKLDKVLCFGEAAPRAGEWWAYQCCVVMLIFSWWSIDKMQDTSHFPWPAFPLWPELSSAAPLWCLACVASCTTHGCPYIMPGCACLSSV